MDYKEIESLIEALSKSNLTYLEIKEKDFGLKLSKTDPIVSETKPLKEHNEDIYEKEEVIDNKDKVQSLEKEKVNYENQFKEEQNHEVKEESTKEDVIKTESEENIEHVNSPIVGTFYSSASPEDESFVKVGSEVKKGETLCIIEAMKLMNEIASPVDGTIVEILCNNEEMVQYGKELFKIKKC